MSMDWDQLPRETATFFTDGGRRRSLAEITAWALSEYGVVLSGGFAQLVGAQGARASTGRIATFFEYPAPRAAAWYAAQTGATQIVWQTEPVAVPATSSASHAVFVWAMGIGNGSALPQPSGQFDLYCNDRLAASFRVVKHSETWSTPASTAAEPVDTARFHFRVRRLETAAPGTGLILDDVLREEAFAAFGLGFLRVPLAWVRRGQPAILRLVPRNPVPSTRWFQLVGAANVLYQTNLYPGLEAVCRGRPRGPVTPTWNGRRLAFGDLHSHSGESDGTGTLEENYAYAHDVANLDFYCLSEHDLHIRGDGWERRLALCRSADCPGAFAALAGYEWTNRVYGHRNVYFRSPDEAIFVPALAARAGPASDDAYAAPPDLWKALDRHGAPALTVPHHPSCASHPFNWAHYSPKYDRVAEIYSVWGNAECYPNRYQGAGSDRYPSAFLRPVLARGYRFGFIASADAHDGHPGNAQSPLVKHHHQFHYLGSGRAAVWVDELSGAAVFDALHIRRCYATTGEPIAVDFRLNDQPMGSELPAMQVGRHPRLEVQVAAPSPLERVQVIRNGRVVHTVQPDEEETALRFAWVESEPSPWAAADALPGPHGPSTYYYVKVIQQDGEMAWSSPIWVDG